VNHFQTLELEDAIDLDVVQLKTNYQKLAKLHHPDHSGDDITFKAINRSYNLLLNVDERISHFLELRNHVVSGRGEISAEVTDLFMPISDLLQKIEMHKKAYIESQSALQKALLAPQTMELQESLENLMESVETIDQSKATHAFNTSCEDTTQYQKLETLSRDLAFLRKWKAQLKQAYGSLVSLAL